MAYVLKHNFLFVYKPDKPLEPHETYRVDDSSITFSDEDSRPYLIIETMHQDPCTIRMMVCEGVDQWRVYIMKYYLL